MRRSEVTPQLWPAAHACRAARPPHRGCTARQLHARPASPSIHPSMRTTTRARHTHPSHRITHRARTHTHAAQPNTATHVTTACDKSALLLSLAAAPCPGADAKESPKSSPAMVSGAGTCPPPPPPPPPPPLLLLLLLPRPLPLPPLAGCRNSSLASSKTTPCGAHHDGPRHERASKRREVPARRGVW